MSEYTVVEREQATDYMEEYPGFGEMRSYTDAADADQVAFTWRKMPPDTGGRGSYGHSHTNQEELYFVVSGELTFKIGADEFKAGPQTLVRIPPASVRSVHNDTDSDVELVMVSVKADEQSGTEKHEDFWPGE